MRVLLLSQLLITFIFAQESSLRHQQPFLKAIWGMEGQELIVSVLENPVEKPQKQVLQVLAASGDRDSVIYTESTIESCLGIIPLGELNENIMVIWQGGAAYTVQVLHRDSTGIRTVLFEKTRVFPEIVYSNDNPGIPVIVLADFNWVRTDKSASSVLQPTKAFKFVWDGSEYIKSVRSWKNRLR